MKRALYMLVLAACGDGGGKAVIDAPPPQIDGVTPRETVMENVPLQVNEIVEGILKGGSGDIAHITMMAPSASLDWNMHSHPNGTTIVVKEELKVMNVDYVFAPSEQADWYLLLRNKGQTDMTVQLKIELFGNMMWTGIQ
jgi:hypothetical protein